MGGRLMTCLRHVNTDPRRKPRALVQEQFVADDKVSGGFADLSRPALPGGEQITRDCN